MPLKWGEGPGQEVPEVGDPQSSPHMSHLTLHPEDVAPDGPF